MKIGKKMNGTYAPTNHNEQGGSTPGHPVKLNEANLNHNVLICTSNKNIICT